MCGRFVYAAQCDENQLAFPQVIFPNEMPLDTICTGPDHGIANNAEPPGTPSVGLIPSWAKRSQNGNRLINCAGETLAKTIISPRLLRRRC